MRKEVDWTGEYKAGRSHAWDDTRRLIAEDSVPALREAIDKTCQAIEEGVEEAPEYWTGYAECFEQRVKDLAQSIFISNLVVTFQGSHPEPSKAGKS